MNNLWQFGGCNMHVLVDASLMASITQGSYRFSGLKFLLSKSSRQFFLGGQIWWIFRILQIFWLLQRIWCIWTNSCLIRVAGRNFEFPAYFMISVRCKNPDKITYNLFFKICFSLPNWATRNPSLIPHWKVALSTTKRFIKKCKIQK